MRILPFALAGLLTTSAATGAVWVQDTGTPPPPPLNYPYRPAPLALGEGYRGNFGTPCYDKIDADGRYYHESRRTLIPGQLFWLSLSSPDFEPTLTIFKLGEADRPFAQLVAAANGRQSGFLFKVTEAGDYVFRTSAPSGRKGRWFTEIIYDGKRENASRDNVWTSVAGGAC